ncbi:MAG: transcriptional activator protein [Gemmatimonadetes bacterium]|nr:transcriptional activator protein [Gemmatimonadota bacterium]
MLTHGRLPAVGVNASLRFQRATVAVIRLRLLGSVDLVGRDGQPLETALRRSKVVTVLAYLAAARPRGFHRRDKIAALFWPGLDAERARAALRVTLTRLRNDLGDDVILTRSADEIATDPLRLWCDVAALDEAIRDGRALEAATHFRGDFLDGVHVKGTSDELEHWIDAERTYVRSELLGALLAESERAERRGDRVATTTALRRAVEIAPSNEPANRRLIVSLAAAGDHGGALHAYEVLTRRLARDFQAAPSAETQLVVRDLRTIATFVDEDDIDSRATHATPATPAAPSSVPAPQRPARTSDAPASVNRRHGFRRVAGVTVAAGIVVSGAMVVHARSTLSASPSSPSAVAAHWFGVIPAGPNPMGRLGGRSILDSTREGIVLFGGALYSGEAKTSQLTNDLWRLRGLRAGESARWVRLAPTGDAPPPRWLFGMTYDAAHDRAIIHGGSRGFTSPCANDTWVLDHASGVGAAPAWKHVATAGQLPPPRADIRLVYAAAARRAIFVGGHDCVNEYTRDVWVLAFDDSTLHSGRWLMLNPDTSAGSPPHRASYSAAYDAAANRLFVFGGNASGKVSSEFWVLDHANGLGGQPSWRPYRCDRTPPALVNTAAAFDSVTHTWVLFGGSDSSGYERRDVWRVTNLDRRNACRWETVATSEPTPNARGDASAFVDTRTNGFVLQGGRYQDTGFSDAWVLSGVFRR